MRRLSRTALSVMLGVLLVVSCKRVSLYDSASDIFLELQLKLNLDLTVSDTIDVDRNQQYYSKLHISEPSRLVACFYSIKSHQLVTKEYVGPTGGYLTSVPPGTYDVLVYQLGTYVTQVSGDELRGQVKAETSDITSTLQAQMRAATRATKALSLLNTDPVISEPDHLIVAKLTDVVVPEHSDMDETVVIHADGASTVETYSFVADSIKGIENVRSVQAVISGQAASKYLWDEHTPSTSVNVLTTAVADRTKNCFYGVYNTFGQVSGQKVYVNFIVTTITGGEIVFPIDITDQVNDPDNKDNRIDIDDVIDITSPGGTANEGYLPTVTEWDKEIVDIPIQR